MWRIDCRGDDDAGGDAAADGVATAAPRNGSWEARRPRDARTAEHASTVAKMVEEEEREEGEEAKKAATLLPPTTADAPFKAAADAAVAVADADAPRVLRCSAQESPIVMTAVDKRRLRAARASTVAVLLALLPLLLLVLVLVLLVLLLAWRIREAAARVEPAAWQAFEAMAVVVVMSWESESDADADAAISIDASSSSAVSLWLLLSAKTHSATALARRTAADTASEGADDEEPELSTASPQARSRALTRVMSGRTTRPEHWRPPRLS